MRLLISLSSLLMLLAAFNLKAQNLVFNPGLEITSSSPTGANQLNKATGWSNCNGNYNTQGSWGSPDLLSLTGTGVAQLPCGYIPCVQPHSGNNVVAFVTYNGYHADNREYVSTNLTAPLQIGKTYSVSFWATTGTSSTAKYATNNIGALFTVNAFWHGSNGLLVNKTPHCNMTSVLDTTGWKYYSFTFVADSAYKYITFGNYYTDANTLLVTKNTSNQIYSYNILDDFSVTLINSAPQSSFLVSDTVVCVGGSVATADASSNSPTTWNWQASGAIPATYTLANPVFFFPNAGTYSISLTSSNTWGTGNTLQKVITVYPNPQISTTASPSVVCKNGHSILSATGASTYTWSISQTGSLVTTPYLPMTGNFLYSVAGTDQYGCTTTTTLALRVVECEVTSIDKYQADDHFLVYPNPNFGSFKIKGSKEQKINLINELGQNIGNFPISNDTNYTMEISDLTPGVYFLQSERFYQKIVVMK